jgi:hypothetical protein
MLSVLTAGGCTAAQRTRASDVGNANVAATAPIIDSVRPDSVTVPYGGVVEVTLYGRGFLAENPGNTLHFDRAQLNAVKGAAGGRRISFVIPDQISSGGGAPPARLASGRYNISVETPGGVSNVVTIRVYR